MAAEAGRAETRIHVSLGPERGAPEATKLKAPQRQDGMTVVGLQRAGGMAASRPGRWTWPCAPRAWAMGKGHFPSRVGQTGLRTKAGPRMGPGLNRGQGGKHPTVSELGREPSAQTLTGLQKALGGSPLHQALQDSGCGRAVGKTGS